MPFSESQFSCFDLVVVRLSFFGVKREWLLIPILSVNNLTPPFTIFIDLI